MDNKVFLYFLSKIYGSLTNIRNRAYDNGYLRITRCHLPVISVGNVTVGGNAKTPLVMFIVQELARRGLKAAVLSRGYGGKAKGPEQVHREHGPRDVGDEPYLMFQRFLRSQLSIPIVIARDRVKGARLIADEGLADLIVLDDGFQHRRLHRDLDIVSINIGSVDAQVDFEKGQLLPFGRFREDRDRALRRARVIVFSERKIVKQTQELDSNLLRLAPHHASLYRSFVKEKGFRNISGECRLESEKVIVTCGIANPSNFYETLESIGFEVVGRKSFPDHYEYTEADIADLRSRYGDYPILCTEKDFVKLCRFEDSKIYSLEIDTEVKPSDAFMSQIMRYIISAKAKNDLPGPSGKNAKLAEG